MLELAQQPQLKSKIVSNTYNEGMLDGHAIAMQISVDTGTHLFDVAVHYSGGNLVIDLG